MPDHEVQMEIIGEDNKIFVAGVLAHLAERWHIKARVQCRKLTPGHSQRAIQGKLTREEIGRESTMRQSQKAEEALIEAADYLGVADLFCEGHSVDAIAQRSSPLRPA